MQCESTNVPDLSFNLRWRSSASAIFELVSDPAYLVFEIGDSSISNADDSWHISKSCFLISRELREHCCHTNTLLMSNTSPVGLPLQRPAASKLGELQGTLRFYR